VHYRQHHLSSPRKALEKRESIKHSEEGRQSDDQVISDGLQDEANIDRAALNSCQAESGVGGSNADDNYDVVILR
jgi:hypothetical protein